MKNIEKLYKLLENGYNIYFSSTANDMEPYIKHLKNFKGFVRVKNSENEKILIFAYLTTYNEIEPEIIVSNEFLVKDHLGAWAHNNAPCTTVFLKCQDIELKKALEELHSKIYNF